jgi:hypothetical protein
MNSRTKGPKTTHYNENKQSTRAPLRGPYPVTGACASDDERIDVLVETTQVLKDVSSTVELSSNLLASMRENWKHLVRANGPRFEQLGKSSARY